MREALPLPRSALSPTMAALRRNFRRGEPVWAFMNGYPWWPARVITVSEVALEPGHLPPQVAENEFLVQFFNDDKSYACLHHEALRAFSDPRHRDINKGKRYYVDAVDEAREYCRVNKWPDPLESSATRNKTGNKRHRESDCDSEGPACSRNRLDVALPASPNEMSYPKISKRRALSLLQTRDRELRKAQEKIRVQRQALSDCGLTAVHHICKDEDREQVLSLLRNKLDSL